MHARRSQPLIAMVIVDTTVWVDYLNDVTTPETEWLDSHLTRQPLGLLDLESRSDESGRRSEARQPAEVVDPRGERFALSVVVSDGSAPGASTPGRACTSVVLHGGDCHRASGHRTSRDRLTMAWRGRRVMPHSGARCTSISASDAVTWSQAR
jgi:hypothetical protein